MNDSSGPSKALLQSVPVARDRQPRTFARAWLDCDRVFLIWPGVAPDQPTRSALARLCAKVTRVGHTSSLVQMWLADPEEVGEPNWVPNEERAVIRLRLALTGTLEYLERQYNHDQVEQFAALKVAEADDSDRKTRRAARKRIREEFGNSAPPQLRPVLSVYCGYAPPDHSEESGTVVAGSVFSPHLIIRRLERSSGPYRQLDLTCVLGLCQRWRQALLSWGNELPLDLRSMLADTTTTAHLFKALTWLSFRLHLSAMNMRTVGCLAWESRCQQTLLRKPAVEF